MTAAAPESVPRRTRWAWLAATFLGIGYLRPGPGTWASAVTVAAWFFLAAQLPLHLHLPVALAIAVVVTLIGIPAGTRVALESGRKDPSFVVLDEVAGQMLALAGVPHGWKYLIVALILFRVFDIVKPPPLRHLERLPGGAGIMLDDVGAGLYALLVFQVLLHLGLLR